MRDEGLIVQAKPFEENKHILTIFTKTHGIWKGLSRTGTTGQLVHCSWRGKGLGFFTIEVVKSYWPVHPFVLSSMCALLNQFLSEHHPYEAFYDLCVALLSKKDIGYYVYFERELLKTLGFEIQTEYCTVTHTSQNLIYLSPKTGKAVSAKVGKPYHDQLLPLPTFLQKNEYKDLTFDQIAQGLRVTGTLLQRHIGFLPIPRQWLTQWIGKNCA